MENIIWTESGIDKLIQHYEENIKVCTEKQEESSFPEGEEEQINRYDECISLLRDMKDKKSWVYKHFNS